jgi:ketosteroid isomerase-like protein
MNLEQKMNVEQNKEFKRFCEECENYQRLSQDDKNVHQNGDTVFTREHYEMLGTYLHRPVVNYLRTLRKDCPEWAFIVSEFHNFVIEHEMQRLQVVWGGRGVGTVQELIGRMQSL